MTKKDIEHIENEINRLDRDYYKIAVVAFLTLVIVIVTLVGVIVLQTEIPQGTWECVEYGEETYVEYWSTIDCTTDDVINSERPYLCISYTIKHDNLYEFEEFVNRNPKFNTTVEVKTRQGDCIKEHLVRSTT